MKHGVAPLHQAGQIKVHFEQWDQTLQVRITDNGRGFTNREPMDGFGLKLTRERIDLLNKLNPEQSIALAFTEGMPAGTEVTITFTHWFI